MQANQSIEIPHPGTLKLGLQTHHDRQKKRMEMGYTVMDPTSYPTAIMLGTVRGLYATENIEFMYAIVAKSSIAQRDVVRSVTLTSTCKEAI